MKFIVTAVAACIAVETLATVSARASTEPPLLSYGNWERIFTDEFNTNKLDGDKWMRCYWWDKDGCTNLGNNELEWYLPANVSVANGHLRLRAKRQTVKGFEGRTFKYTSGMVTTGRHYDDRAKPDRFATQFGYFEMRAKIPKGKGLWPAFWLLPSAQEPLPEIDIMEVLGDATRKLEVHLHYKDAQGQRQTVGSSIATKDLARNWHVYGVNWSKDAVVWYLDGIEVWRYEKAPGIPNEQMYLLINLAVGGNWPGDPDAKTHFPADFLIDYVRVWRRIDG
jgi:beta-glucanase (GH16 family)